MIPTIAILDAADLDALPAAATSHERGRRAWISALSRQGPLFFIDNADVSVKGLAVDRQVVPLVLADRASGNSDVCSVSNHYVAYTLEEIIKRHRTLPSILLRTAMLSLQAILSAGKVDRAVYVNNWLLATNPTLRLSAAQITAVTAFLAAAYPDAAIVVRTVNPTQDPEHVERLRQAGYRLIRSRRVYLMDAGSLRTLSRTDARIDRQLLEHTPYEVVDDRRVLIHHTARLTRLYRELYLDKHSLLNPQFNERFFASTLANEILEYRALTRNGRIDGFISFYEEADELIGGVVGYDREVAVEAGLYRLLFAIFMMEGAKRGLPVHLSAGADRFKVLRGALAAEEYDAVFVRHLSVGRQLAWRSLQVATSIWSRLRRPPLMHSAKRHH